MIIEHEGRRFEMVDWRVPVIGDLVLDPRRGAARCVAINSFMPVQPILRELPAETTITRAEFEKQYGPGWWISDGRAWWMVGPATGRAVGHYKLVSSGCDPVGEILGPVVKCRRAGFSTNPVLAIIDPPPAAKPFPPAGTVLRACGLSVTAVVTHSGPSSCTVNGQMYLTRENLWLHWEEVCKPEAK